MDRKSMMKEILQRLVSMYGDTLTTQELADELQIGVRHIYNLVCIARRTGAGGLYGSAVQTRRSGALRFPAVAVAGHLADVRRAK